MAKTVFHVLHGEYNMILRAVIGMTVGILIGLTGCRPAASPMPNPLDPGRLDGDMALEEARSLAAIRPRDAGTPGAQKAAEHLMKRLQAMDIQASLDVFEETCFDGSMVFRNVIGVIPMVCSGNGGQAGQDWVVLGSHYDTKAGIGEPFEGANDSASSSGLLLVLARLIKTGSPHPFNVLIAFFDGEECRIRYGPRDGLHGSRRLAKTLQNDGRSAHVRAVIILDMVGDKDLRITLPRNGTPRLMSMVFRAAETEGVRDKFSLFSAEMVDDHLPFLRAGMPAVDIIDFEYGSAPGKNDYWHTPADTMDKLSAKSLTTVGRVVIRMLNDLMKNPPAERK